MRLPGNKMAGGPARPVSNVPCMTLGLISVLRASISDYTNPPGVLPMLRSTDDSSYFTQTWSIDSLLSIGRQISIATNL